MVYCDGEIGSKKTDRRVGKEHKCSCLYGFCGRTRSDDPYIRIDKVFNSNPTSFFQGSNIDNLMDTMFTHIKKHVEYPALPQSGFTIDRILHMDFHKLRLTRGSSYIELPVKISRKKAIINPKNEDKGCFKWSVIAALHHEEIGRDPQRISKLWRASVPLG